VLCSSVTAELLGGTELVDLGEHRLRDLSARQRVFQVGAGRFPPLRSLDAFPGNLPLQVSSFIGRDAELARADQALDEARVVTLTGVGGVGKTRLALQVAALVLPRFRDGAWLVELATVRDRTGVVTAVATGLEVSAHGGRSLEESLVEFLRTKRLLLVLDNAEHLLEAVAELVERLGRTCAGLVVLVTSREGLALAGERVLPVPSLAVPPPGTRPLAAAGADAVRLFVERAGAADPDFALTEGNTAAVVEVCRRLDGVPLAIELAAARVSAMTPAELATGLDRRFATLAGGRRRAVPRHQTLRAAIDWSYELLTDAERRLLARLAVFAGGWTRAAAEAVCAGPPMAAGQVFEGLAGLVDKSLVVAERQGAETRYRLLETILEYGEGKLAELGETEAVRAAHAEYFCALTRRLHDQLFGPEQVTAAYRLVADWDNLLAAMHHALDTGDVDLALRIASQWPPVHLQVGQRLVLPVEAALELTGARDHSLYASGLVLAATMAAFRGDVDQADAWVEEALAALPWRGHDPLVEASLAQIRAALASARGAFAEAARLLAEGAELARSSHAIGSTHAASFMLSSAAMAHMMAGDAEAGEPLAREAVALARQGGAPSQIARGLEALAGALAGSDPARAKAALDESLKLQERLDFNAAGPVESALIAARMADWPLVLRLGLDKLRRQHSSADMLYFPGLLNVIARALASSDTEAAAVLQGAARRVITTTIRGSAPSQVIGVDPTSSLDRAAGPASFIADLRRQTTTIIRETIGDEPLRQLRAEGEAMDADQAARYAAAAIERNLNTLEPEPQMPGAPV
jgi:predicted ATPase